MVSVGQRENRQRHRSTFSTLGDAVAWVEDMKRGQRLGMPVEDAAPKRAAVPTVREAANTLTKRMVRGDVRARGGHPFSPATIENYAGERAAKRRVKAARERAEAAGADPATVRQGSGTGTARLAVAALRQVLADLYRRGAMARAIRAASRNTTPAVPSIPAAVP